MKTGLGGCRLSNGRLHLGHLHGCFNNSKFSGLQSYYFVVQDRSFSRCFTLPFEVDPLLNLVAEIYAIDTPIPTRIVRQSRLFHEYSDIFDILINMSNCSLLEDTHPNKSLIAERKNLSVKDYLFPLEQVAQFFCLDVSKVLMNDDNQRFVHLARRLRKKIHKKYPDISFVRPTLSAGEVTRLIGFNGRKMSKGNGNAIFLDTDGDELADCISKYLPLKRLFSLGVEHRIKYKEAGEHMLLPKGFPLLSIYRAFVKEEDEGFKIRDLDYISREIVSCLTKQFKSISEKKAELLSNKKSLIDRLHRDEYVAKQTVSQVLENSIRGSS